MLRGPRNGRLLDPYCSDTTPEISIHLLLRMLPQWLRRRLLILEHVLLLLLRQRMGMRMMLMWPLLLRLNLIEFLLSHKHFHKCLLLSIGCSLVECRESLMQ